MVTIKCDGAVSMVEWSSAFNAAQKYMLFTKKVWRFEIINLSKSDLSENIWLYRNTDVMILRLN